MSLQTLASARTLLKTPIEITLGDLLIRPSSEGLEEDPLMRQALIDAKKIHWNESRHNGKPYLDGHLYPCTLSILDYFSLPSNAIEQYNRTSERKISKRDLAIITLLHDSLESQRSFEEKLRASYPENIVRPIKILTKNQGIEEHAQSRHDWLSAVDRTYFNDLRNGDIDVIVPKLIDKLHNTRTLHYVPDGRKRLDHIQKNAGIFIPLAQRTCQILYHALSSATAEKTPTIDSAYHLIPKGVTILK